MTMPMMHPIARLIVQHPSHQEARRVALAARAAHIPVTSEAPIGVYMWGVLVFIINFTWITMDVWLYRTGHEMLTDEFREGIKHPVYGPLIAFVLFGSIFAFLFHMYVAKSPNGIG